MSSLGTRGRCPFKCAGFAFLILILFPSLIACGGRGAPAPGETLTLSLSPFASGLDSPVGVYNAGFPDDRLFVIQRTGAIRIVQANGVVIGAPFLDISARVESGGSEQGLLGLAFHPAFAANGFFYINYTNTTAGITRTRISRFNVAANPDFADSDSEVILFTVDQPFANHNAGDIHFGPDGFLYIPLGDGGSGGDPGNNAQDSSLLLGKVARIDVDAGSGGSADCLGTGTGGYTVPAGNPLVDGPGGNCDEIWAIGLRNPWRSSFDRLTGDFYIGDVGQSAREEVDFQPAGAQGGINYGWRCFEGNLPFNSTGCAPADTFSFPVFDYPNPGSGCSVIGGYVYRGKRFPALMGHYVLTDFCSGNFWDMVPDGAGGWLVNLHTNLAAFGYVSFGEDSDGEIYVVHQGNGTLHRLEGN